MEVWSESDLVEMITEALTEARKKLKNPTRIGCPKCGNKEMYVEDRNVIGSCNVGSKITCETGQAWDTYLICRNCGKEYYLGGGSG